MVDVKPLEAIVYNQEKVDINKVIAPPYDVISEDYAKELFERSEYNIINLILAKGSTNPKDENNRYKNANKCYQKWLNENILVKTDKPCIFYLLQKYSTNDGKDITRKGFIARCKIEDFSTKKILPHEYTMGGPKEDRLNLTKECRANFSQVFFVYSDKEKQIENAINYSQKPFIDVVDDAGVQNIVYKIDDEKIINLIENLLKDKTLLIADGHHRYETAMNYSKLNPDKNYVMSYFTNSEDDLLIFPTHRIITKKISKEKLLESVKKYFDIKEFEYNSENKKNVKKEFLKAIEEENKNTIAMGLCIRNDNKFYLLTLRENVDSIVDAPEVLKSLDLVVLHKVILEKELGYSQEEMMSQNGVLYEKQEDKAFDMSGETQASFIMAYPKIEDIKRISSAGERMPQKSTYFYPKLLSGIVINPL